MNASSVDFILSESANVGADSRKGSTFREAALQPIETSTELRSVTSIEDLGFSMPLRGSSAPPLVVQGCDRRSPTEKPSDNKNLESII